MFWGKNAHSELCELQGHLDEGIRAGATLLYQALPEVAKEAAIKINVVRDLHGQSVRRIHHILALTDTRVRNSQR